MFISPAYHIMKCRSSSLSKNNCKGRVLPGGKRTNEIRIKWTLIKLDIKYSGPIADEPADQSDRRSGARIGCLCQQQQTAAHRQTRDVPGGLFHSENWVKNTGEPALVHVSGIAAFELSACGIAAIMRQSRLSIFNVPETFPAFLMSTVSHFTVGNFSIGDFLHLPISNSTKSSFINIYKTYSNQYINPSHYCHSIPSHHLIMTLGIHLIQQSSSMIINSSLSRCGFVMLNISTNDLNMIRPFSSFSFFALSPSSSSSSPLLSSLLTFVAMHVLSSCSMPLQAGAPSALEAQQLSKLVITIVQDPVLSGAVYLTRRVRRLGRRTVGLLLDISGGSSLKLK